MGLPKFFKDDSESMKYEETIDFFLSWTIRCADIVYKKENEIVYNYSKLILQKLLLNFSISNELIFKNIKVWKQHSNIDLWVELTIEDYGIEQKAAIIIENKMYSSIRNCQLEKYNKIATEYYKTDNIKIAYIFLRPDYEIGNKTNEKAKCKELGYMYLNLEELKDALPNKKTKNHLFDEFWFNW